MIDTEQRLIRVFGGGNGVLYAVDADGALRWWRHTGAATGAGSWVGGRAIGSDWHTAVELLAGHDGAIVAVYGDGTVRRSRYVCTDLGTGAGYWESVSVKVADGWGRFPRVFGGPDGVLYGVDAAGDLWRSQYNGSALSAPVKIGGGWQGAAPLIADAGGVIYGVRRGDLVWWRYTPGGGWAGGGVGATIGTAWGDTVHPAFVAGGQGVIYVVDVNRSTPYPGSDHELKWFRLLNWTDPTAGAQWAGNVGAVVGEGWTAERTANLQGYAWPISAAPGETVGAHVSTTFDEVTTSVWRHVPGGAPTRMTDDMPHVGRLQRLPSGYRSRGCDWDSLHDVTVPDSWPSGLYSIRLEGPAGLRRHLPFVVRPACPAVKLAVVVPWLTYNAYSTWGGHSAYTPGQGGVARALTLQRPSSVTHVEATGQLDFEMYSDLLLLRWLSANGYTYDVYTDLDVHREPSLLTAYRGVVLGTHPEYTSEAVQRGLKSYVDSGGRLVYPGGNGLYERVTISRDGTAVAYRRDDGSRDLWREAGLPESQIIGVGFEWLGWGTFAPYKVVANHPLLAGTGLGPGSVFGAGGYNFGASGQETDTAPAGQPGATVIAVGQNTPQGGANMTIVERANGGFTFSAASLSFTGALASDAPLSRLFKNVMDRAIAP